MSTILWVIATNAVTAFTVWRLMAWYARNLPSVLAQLNTSKLHEHLTDEDVAWIKEQAGTNPNWLREKTSSATTSGQDQSSTTSSSSETADSSR